MPVTAGERRLILNNLAGRAEREIAALWSAAERLAEDRFAAYVAEAFPDIVDPYHQIASQFAASVFDDEFPGQVPARPAAPLPAGQLQSSARWALATSEGRDAITKLSGVVQRAIYDGDRQTVALNSRTRGMRWIRVARPGACEFCKMLATRAVGEDWRDYTYDASGVERGEDGKLRLLVTGSKGTRNKKAVGERYHDFCHCTAAPVPDGVTPYEVLAEVAPDTAELVDAWELRYQKATAEAGGTDTKKLLAAWRQLDKG